MGLELITAPTKDPVSLDTALCHLRATRGDEDALVQTYIRAAVAYCQEFTGRQFVTATYEQTFDRFDDVLALAKPPLISVTEIRYIDPDGVEQTETNSPIVYEVDTNTTPGRVRRAFGASWPSYRRQANAVTVKYQAGYGGPEDVDASVKSAILLWAAQLFEHREPVVINEIARRVPFGVRDLLWSLKVAEVA